RLLASAALSLASLCAAATTVTFNYTGAVQTFTVPDGVQIITVDAYGAQGFSSGSPGGSGGRAPGDISAGPGQVLNIFVGGAGTAATGNRVPSGGGFNGGGHGLSDG